MDETQSQVVEVERSGEGENIASKVVGDITSSISRRKKNGTWLKGENGQVFGRSRGIAHYKSLITGAIDDAQFVQIVKQVGKRAAKGDLNAANMVLDRIVGKPKQEVSVEHTTTDPAQADRQMRAMLAADPELRAHVIGMMGNDVIERIGVSVSRTVESVATTVEGGGVPKSDGRYDTISPQTSTADIPSSTKDDTTTKKNDLTPCTYATPPAMIATPGSADHAALASMLTDVDSELKMEVAKVNERVAKNRKASKRKKAANGNKKQSRRSRILGG